jgi:hypothetical protein
LEAPVDNDVATFAAVMAILVPSFAIVVATVVLGIRSLRRKEDSRAALSPIDVERMARLEQAVDAIALELERVGEGQRYLTQIMSQRLPASIASIESMSSHPSQPASGPAESQRGRVITPH